MFRKDTEFQKTEIGEFPKEWKVKKLKEIVIKAKAGGTPRRNISEYWNGNIPFVKIQDITRANKYLYTSEEFITEKGLKNSNAWIVPKDSLLLAIYGSLGSVAINKIPVATNQAIVGIIPNSSIIDTEFLYYWFLYFKPYWYKFIKKSTQPNLTLETVLNSLVPTPPLEEQKRIANILSMIDSGIESVDRAIAKLERIKKALLNELLTGRIRVREESGKLMFYRETEFQDTEIGKIPKDWKIEKINNIVIKAKMGGTPKSTVHEYWGGDIPFAKVEDITSSRKYLFKTSTTITKLGLENSNAWIVPKDSLLITIYGTLGSVAINKIELATNQAIVGIIPRKDIVDVEYLYYWYSFFQPNWNKYVKKNTQPNLTLRIVTNSKLPLPSIKEQKRIVDILSTIDSTIELYYREKEKLLRLRRGLMGVLLTGRVRVVSDVRDVGVVV
jgi:type I restriction enzyme S subunit